VIGHEKPSKVKAGEPVYRIVEDHVLNGIRIGNNILVSKINNQAAMNAPDAMIHEKRKFGWILCHRNNPNPVRRSRNVAMIGNMLDINAIWNL
jgi:hypothetical protein